MLSFRSFFFVLIVGCLLGFLFFAPPVKRNPPPKLVSLNSKNIESEVNNSFDKNSRQLILPDQDSELVRLEEQILNSLEDTNKKELTKIGPAQILTAKVEAVPQVEESNLKELIVEEADPYDQSHARFRSNILTISRDVIYYDRTGATGTKASLNFMPVEPNENQGWQKIKFDYNPKYRDNSQTTLGEYNLLSTSNIESENLALKEKLLATELLAEIGQKNLEAHRIIDTADGQKAINRETTKSDSRAMLKVERQSIASKGLYATLLSQRENLRIGPGKLYSSVVVAEQGAELQVELIRNNWCRVVTKEGVRAWVPRESIKIHNNMS